MRKRWHYLRTCLLLIHFRVWSSWYQCCIISILQIHDDDDDEYHVSFALVSVTLPLVNEPAVSWAPGPAHSTGSCVCTQSTRGHKDAASSYQTHPQLCPVSQMLSEWTPHRNQALPRWPCRGWASAPRNHTAKKWHGKQKQKKMGYFLFFTLRAAAHFAHRGSIWIDHSHNGNPAFIWWRQREQWHTI